MPSAMRNPSRTSPLWLVTGVLVLFYFLFRLPGLMALPIFGDEAIYLVWVDRIREGHLWVSLHDPKPPLHFWLIAASQSIFEIFNHGVDPLLPARFLSVLTGAGSIVAMSLLVPAIAELCPHRTGNDSPRVVTLFAALLLVFCPFAAFYHRLATADALFVLQMLLFLWATARWALSLTGPPSRTFVWAATAGVILGSAALTRQNISYVLVGMLPVVLLLAYLKLPVESSRIKFFETTAWSALLIIGVAVVLFLPVVLTSAVETDLRSRFLYQSHFTDESVSRTSVAWRNFKLAFVPTVTERGPETGWLFFYLTGPVYVAALLAWPYLLFRRHERALLFIAAATVLMLGPVIVLGNVIFSRYILAGAVLLLIPAAMAVADIGATLFSWARDRRTPSIVAWAALLILLLALLYPGLAEISRQNHNWPAQTLTRRDRYQYITGWTSGYAPRQVVEAIKGIAEERPVVVITSDGWGHPSDTLWAYLQHARNVTVYYTVPGEGPILKPVVGEPNYFVLRQHKWRFTPAERCHIAPEARVLYIANEFLTPQGKWPLIEQMRRANGEVAGVPFYGIEGEAAAEDRILMVPLR